MGGYWSSGPDFSSSEEEDVSNDEGLVESPDNLESAMRRGVSSFFDVPIRTHSVNRVSLRKLLPSCITSFSVRRKDSQGCTADVKDTPPSPEEKMTTGSIESIDSGVSLKSDQSKAEQFDFKDRVSPRGRETNQEVGWKHLEAPVSSCS